LGEASIGVMAFIERGFKSILLRKDPTNYGSLWGKMFDYSWYIHTRIGLSALSGVDIALIDLVGKAMGVPACKILGRQYRDKVRPYASRALMIPESHLESCQEAVNLIEKGFTAVKVSFSRFPNFGDNLK
jgi:galactonate dehydratase